MKTVKERNDMKLIILDYIVKIPSNDPITSIKIHDELLQDTPIKEFNDLVKEMGEYEGLLEIKEHSPYYLEILKITPNGRKAQQNRFWE